MNFKIPRPGQILTTSRRRDEDPELRESMTKLSERFQHVFADLVRRHNFPALVIRARLPFNAVYVTDQDHLWVIGDVARGIPYQRVVFRSDVAFTEAQIEHAASWEFGYDDPFFVKIPRSVADLPEDRDDEVVAALEEAANDLLLREYHRFVASTQTIRLRPLFGDPPLRAKHNVCFVIAPFAPERTQIFQEIVKPTIEANDLACIRADDLRTNRAIVQNIWESICEARFLIADITTGNANVFYELGIAHTVGKEVILIEERPREGQVPKRVFDTMGIDAIIYENSATGGQYLRQELDRRIKATLARVVVPEVFDFANSEEETS